MENAKEPTMAKSILLTENQIEIKAINRIAQQWLDNINAAVTAWEKLGILTPYSINILIDNDFREWYFREQQRVNPVLKSINIQAYQFPEDVETIQRVSDWLRHEDTKIQYQMFVKYENGKYELNHEAIEQIKNQRARTFAVSPENQTALMMAERIERTMNLLCEYLESGVNGDRLQRIDPFTFLEWVSVPTSKGMRERVKLRRDVFRDNKSPVPQNDIDGLLRMIRARND